MDRLKFTKFKMLIVWSLALCVHFTRSAVTFLEHPQSVNTTLNSTVNFTCIVQADSLSGIVWTVNNVTMKPAPVPTNLGNSRTSSSLIISAVEGINASEIKCIAVVLTENYSSERAILLIQGHLDPPSWQSVQFFDEILELHWNKPYTLANVAIDQYHISINQNFSLIVKEFTISGSNNTSVDVDDVLTECSNYTVYISASNSVGMSKRNNYSLHYPGVPQIECSEIKLTAVMEQRIKLDLEVDVVFTCQQQPKSSAHSLLHLTTDNSSYCYRTNETILSASFDNLAPNRNYKVDLTLLYTSGKTNIANVCQISTFDIPEFDFRKSNVISNSSSYNYRLPSTDQQFEPTSVIPAVSKNYFSVSSLLDPSLSQMLNTLPLKSSSDQDMIILASSISAGFIIICLIGCLSVICIFVFLKLKKDPTREYSITTSVNPIYGQDLPKLNNTALNKLSTSHIYNEIHHVKGENSYIKTEDPLSRPEQQSDEEDWTQNPTYDLTFKKMMENFTEAEMNDAKLIVSEQCPAYGHLLATSSAYKKDMENTQTEAHIYEQL